MSYMIPFLKAAPVSAEVAEGDTFFPGAEVPGSWDGAAPRRRLDHDDSGHLRMQ